MRDDAPRRRNDRFRQWWKRTVRGGHAFAEVNALHHEMWRRENRSLWAWGLALPAVAVLAALATHGLGLVLLGAYPALWLRILMRRRTRGDAWRTSALYAASCLVGKFWELRRSPPVPLGPDGRRPQPAD